MASSAIRISAFDSKGRERDRAFEFDSQDRSGLEPDVVAFGHQQAAHRPTPDRAPDCPARARHYPDPAARRDPDYSADRAEPAAASRILRRASARMSAADLALFVLGFQLGVVGVIVNGDDGD